MQKTKYLLIDSQDRVSGVSHNFSIQLNPGIQPIKYVKLLGVSIPLSNYIITALNQDIYFTDNGTSIQYVAYITPGVYDSVQCQLL